jgi:type IV secretory pathway TrbD component
VISGDADQLRILRSGKKSPKIGGIENKWPGSLDRGLFPDAIAGARMSKNSDGAESVHAGADGSVPQAWVWSQYKGVLPGVKSGGSAVAKESVPIAGSRSQIKIELPQTVADRQSTPEPETLISTDRARHPFAVATGLAAAVLILVVLAWFFSPGPAP